MTVGNGGYVEVVRLDDFAALMRVAKAAYAFWFPAAVEDDATAFRLEREFTAALLSLPSDLLERIKEVQP